MTAPDLFALPVDDSDLARLEECLRESVLGEDPFLNEVASHLIQAGGKRLRPALALTATRLLPGEVSRETLLGGVSVELVHLASLYHDDVMDEASRRRSVDSVNARWGNLVAIVAGDFLLARSAEIAASLGPEVAGLLAATLARLCQGQVAEVRAAFQIERDEKDYLTAIANKTAALMATACRVGGLTAQLARPQIDELTAFGEAFGMVFQIRDDVLDVIATEEELGKKPGQDLTEGIYTLPVQRALQDRVHGPRLRDLLGKPLSEHERELARALVAASPGIGAAIELARHYAAAASDAAHRLGHNSLASALSALSTRVVDDLERTALSARERFEALAG
ncbi:MAG TPA: polyprenyl synthetase family protein [Acidimicrobiales bacterium]|nr:polyprenyl synthetase family protein [Acidimicrobiales bacterium]